MFTTWYDMDRTFSAIDEFRRRLDRLFDEGAEPQTVSGYGDFPRTNLYDNGESLVLKAELPGLGDKDVNLALHHNVLTLSGERRTVAPEGYSVHRRERTPVRFSRSFTLPVDVDGTKVTASMKNGILSVMLPKTPAALPKPISIKVE